MALWNKRRTRQFIVLTLMTLLFVASGALAAYADSAERHTAIPAHDRAQGDATPTATLAAASSGSGVEAAVLGSTAAATSTATLTPTKPPPTPTPIPSPANVIVNGGFEDGFVEGQGQGVGWGRFQNGDVWAGWYDDTWTKVVFEGKHAQLLELKDARKNDRYVGIFQTVKVVPGAAYVLTLHGLVRSDSGSPQASDYGYRLQYGIDYKGGVNWEATDIKWVELMWDDQPREDKTGDVQYRMETYTATVKAETDKLTLFIRGWKKWADAGEGNYDIDGISLVGLPAPGGPQPGQPTATPGPGMPETGNPVAFLDNPVLVVASAALLVVLAGGAIWGLGRRRA